MKLVGGIGVALVAAALAPLVFVLFVVTSAGGAGPLASASCATDGNLAPILATIREVESGDDYTAEAAGSSASGAYQFVDGTWNRFGGYSHGSDAPPDVQDQKAADMVRAVLERHDGQVSAVPVVWYLGHLPADGSPRWDTVPAPEAGNVLTPRQYQAKWLDRYAAVVKSDDAMSCVLGAGWSGPLPDKVDCDQISWGGYDNGRIPYSAMRYRRHSGYLHPTASAKFDELYAAALAAGLDLSGSGYRPASAGGATAGTSCHGLGLAIDVDVLVPGNRYPTTEAAFASAEFTWLCHNAHHFGWITPRWSIPKGAICGPVVGTGTGGHVGNECCFLEPWHLETPLTAS